MLLSVSFFVFVVFAVVDYTVAVADDTDNDVDDDDASHTNNIPEFQTLSVYCARHALPR